MKEKLPTIVGRNVYVRTGIRARLASSHQSAVFNFVTVILAPNGSQRDENSPVQWVGLNQLALAQAEARF